MAPPSTHNDAADTLTITGKDAFLDLQQSRLTANLFVCLTGVFLAFTQLPNLLIIIVIGVITAAVVLGRGGLLIYTIPLAITVNSLIGTWGFQQYEGGVQLSDLITTALLLTYLSLSCARLELGRTSWRSIVMFSEPQPIEQGDRYRLRPISGLGMIILMAAFLAFIMVVLTPFRDVSPNFTGLIRPSTRMLLLIWSMAIPYMILQIVFRRMRWRQQGQLEARMHVLQTLGDYLASDQDAIVRRRNRLQAKAARKSS